MIQGCMTGLCIYSGTHPGSTLADPGSGHAKNRHVTHPAGFPALRTRQNRTAGGIPARMRPCNAEDSH